VCAKPAHVAKPTQQRPALINRSLARSAVRENKAFIQCRRKVVWRAIEGKAVNAYARAQRRACRAVARRPTAKFVRRGAQLLGGNAK